jgi:hypothetical protein
MAKFKVGDKAICVKYSGGSFTLGKIYTYEINNYSADFRNDFTTTDDNGTPNGMLAGSYKLIEPEEKTIYQSYREEPRLDTWTESAPNKGLRYNGNKLRWRNFPMFLMKPLIEVAQYGESKYDTFNFLKGQTMLDSMDSLKRHLEQFESPYDPDEDSESKVNHLAHVAWNALVALHMLKTRPDLDDRFKLPENEIKEVAEEIQKRGR